MKCPGSDSRFLRVKVVQCPKCRYGVEIFSDETRRRCPKCRTFVYQEKAPACIDWCTHAKECIGEERWKELKGLLDKGR